MKVNLTIGIPVWVDKVCAYPLMFYRKRKYGYDYRRIYLGEGEWTIVDADIYYRLGHLKWSATGKDDRIYAARIIKKTMSGRVKSVYLHREIMDAPKGLVVDHINSDPLDNRRANLRLVTQAQNLLNRRKRKNTTSRFIGVAFDKRTSQWSSHIFSGGKSIWLGRFDNEIDAARAYDAAARKYHGEFAKANFPDESKLSAGGDDLTRFI